MSGSRYTVVVVFVQPSLCCCWPCCGGFAPALNLTSCFCPFCFAFLFLSWLLLAPVPQRVRAGRFQEHGVGTGPRASVPGRRHQGEQHGFMHVLGVSATFPCVVVRRRCFVPLGRCVCEACAKVALVRAKMPLVCLARLFLWPHPTRAMIEG